MRKRNLFRFIQFFVLISTILFIPSVMSADSSRTCIEDNILLIVINKTIVVDGTPKNIYMSEPSYCSMGCYRGKCIENVQGNTMFLPAVMYLSVMVFYYILWRNMEVNVAGDHTGKFRIFFLMMLFLHVIGGLVLAMNYVENNFISYQVGLWSGWITVEYLMFFVTLVLTMIFTTERGMKIWKNIVSKLKSELHD